MNVGPAVCPGNANSPITTYDGSSQSSTCQGMNTSGSTRGSAWCARCLRASSESTGTPPTLRGRQCRITTWMTHSITGKNATSATGAIRSVHANDCRVAR